MKIGKTLKDFAIDQLRESNMTGRRRFISGDELWKAEHGKSIYQVGTSPDKNIQLHRMEADRLEQVAEKIANLSVYSLMMGDHANSKRLSDQYQEIKRLATMHRRQAEL